MKNEPSFKLVIAIVIAGVIVSLISPSHANSVAASQPSAAISEDSAPLAAQ